MDHQVIQFRAIKNHSRCFYFQRNMSTSRFRKHASNKKAMDRDCGEPRTGPSVVRQSSHDGMVDSPLAERGLCSVHRIFVRRSFVPTLRHLETVCQ